MKRLKFDLVGDDERGWTWQAWTIHGAQCMGMSWRNFKTRRLAIAAVRRFQKAVAGGIQVTSPFDWKKRAQPPSVLIP